MVINKRKIVALLLILVMIAGSGVMFGAVSAGTLVGGAKITVNPAKLDFGYVKLGEKSASKVVTITLSEPLYDSTEKITISDCDAPGKVGGNLVDFSFECSDIDWETDLKGTFTVTFNPAELEDFDGKYESTFYLYVEEPDTADPNNVEDPYNDYYPAGMAEITFTGTSDPSNSQPIVQPKTGDTSMMYALILMFGVILSSGIIVYRLRQQ